MSDRGSIVAMRSLLRHLPLFFRTEPRTPLRVLCIASLDTLHVLSRGRPLPRRRTREIGAFLDFQACTNALWDHKPLHVEEYREMRHRLQEAGLTRWVEPYLVRIRELEDARPEIGGDERRFDEVRAYRESVIRLSLASVSALAFEATVDDAIGWTRDDGDLNVLFRIAIQCQIVDDVLDYWDDKEAGLPSYLTSMRSRCEAMALTERAAREYGNMEDVRTAVLALRVALRVVTGLTTWLVRVARGRRRNHHTSGAVWEA